MVQNSNVVQYHISLFGGENYEYLCVKMKTLLISQDLWILVSVGYTDSVDQVAYNALLVDQKTELKENRQNDEKTMFILQVGVEIKVSLKIA